MNVLRPALALGREGAVADRGAIGRRLRRGLGRWLGWGVAAGLLMAAVSGLAAESFRSVYLAEVVTGNRKGLVDEHGARWGWVEVANAGDAPVNLKGWFLTDEPAQLTKWRFPEVVIPPGKQLVVFASGRTNVSDAPQLHASFRLEPGTGYLALVDRRTNVVSSLSAGLSGLPPDTAYGSARGEPALRGVLGKPTPGKANTLSGPGFAPGVRFSRPPGNFLEPFSLELSVAGGGESGSVPTNVVLRYTLDGTLPNRTSPVYAGPLTITNTAHLRARVYAEGLLPGPPASVAYLRLFTNVVSFRSRLPVLVLDAFGRELPVSPRTTFAHVALHEPVNGWTSLTNPPSLALRAGYRVRGSTSAGMAQSGFAVEFVDEFDDERSVPLLGLPADSDWILYAPNAYDPVLIHNPFVHGLSRDMGRYSPRTRFVEVFVVTGAGRVREAHYHGLHVLEEKITIGRDRVAIDRLGPADLTPPAVTGGYVLKFDRLGPDEAGVFYEGDRGLAFVEPREQTLRLPQRSAQRKYITGYLREFERALHGPQWRDPELGYRAYLDVEAAIDFHVLEVLSGNVDAIVLSTYFHKPRGGKITFGPHWDFDRALGSTDGRDDDPRQWNTGPFFGGAWWPRLFTDVDFWQRWVDRWQELRQTHFSVPSLEARIDRLVTEMGDAQPRQYARWGFQPRGGSHAAEVQWMKRWLSNRVDYIDGQLARPPRVERPGGPSGPVVLAAPGGSTNAVIYLTLDGTDPRALGGGVATQAMVYASPLNLGPGQRLTARVQDRGRRQVDGPPRSTPWSGPVRVP